MSDPQPELLRSLPSVTELLKSEAARGWLERHPQPLVTDCLRHALMEVRRQMLEGTAGKPETGAAPGNLTGPDSTLDLGPSSFDPAAVLARAENHLTRATEPRVREAINATGIILHTGLGRAALAASVVDSLAGELKGYCTLAVDRQTGERAERDELVEYILTELTGAEAATVVNNNAAATMLVLAALAASKEVIVSRGQLIEIGGSFRLPEVMAQSGAQLVEVGATNRTHLKDYQRAITEKTAAILRVHPSNYRVVGFTSEAPLRELSELCRHRNLLLLDDLGAGALLDLQRFGLPHEPTVRESLEAGADVVLFSGDKLIGAGQSGIIVGKKPLIEKLRRHPLMRAVRVDKTCLMVLERTLQLFRDPARLAREHPTYRMISTPLAEVKARAEKLARLIRAAAPGARAEIQESQSYVGSGSLPTEALPSFEVLLSLPGQSAASLARRLRLDEACIFGRIEDDRVRLNARTVAEAQLPAIASALARIAA
jgi:L-seryl-tRNA(Ser) seleniumtransferase